MTPRVAGRDRIFIAQSARAESVAYVALAAAVALLSLDVHAQQLEPRSYSNIPIGMNFLVSGYVHTDGSIGTDAASPLQDAEVHTDNALIGYARSFGLWGTSGKFDIIGGQSWVSGSATFLGQPRARKVNGLIDPQFRVAINLYGAPAMRLSEFTNYQQNIIVGMSLAVTAPLGAYEDDKLLNIGNNRWSFKPELGVSKAFGRFTLELAPGVTIFTDNEHYFNNTRREQDPVFSGQAHGIYSFRRGYWGAVSATYYSGGDSTLNGIRQDDRQENVRIGGTLTIPLVKHPSVKLYGSTGVWSRSGSDFWLAGIAFQYRWGGGL